MGQDKEMKSIREGINIGKMESFIFLILNYLKENCWNNDSNDIFNDYRSWKMKVNDNNIIKEGREKIRISCYRLTALHMICNNVIQW